MRTCFPTEAHRTEFLASVSRWPDSDIRLLLRNFLVCTGTNIVDDGHANFLIHQLSEGTRKASELREHERRLVKMTATGNFPVWEGIHWVIDLLPHHPRAALHSLDAFFLARCQDLKDVYITGLYDAQTLIRARYIANPADQAAASAILDTLDWRELEWLCGALYRAMGFNVTVTPRSHDDGIDVLAERDDLGMRQRLIVQAKKRSIANRLKKQDWHTVLGAVTDHKATGGVLITTGRVQSGVRAKSAQDARCQGIDRDQLLALLNEHCGAAWHQHVDQLIAEEQRRAARSA